MTGNELLRKLKKLSKKMGVECEFICERGKGSHGTIYFGTERSILKDRKKEIGPGLLNAMCKQLKITLQDLNEG